MSMNVYIGVEGFQQTNLSLDLLVPREMKNRFIWIGLSPSSLAKSKPFVNGGCVDYWKFTVPLNQVSAQEIKISVKEKILLSENLISSVSLPLSSFQVNTVLLFWQEMTQINDRKFRIQLRLHLDTQGAPPFQPYTNSPNQPQVSYPQPSQNQQYQYPQQPQQQQYQYPQQNQQQQVQYPQQQPVQNEYPSNPFQSNVQYNPNAQQNLYYPPPPA